MGINSLSERIIVFGDTVSKAGELAQVDSGKFDLIFSNPPFYATASGRLNQSSEKLQARHEVLGNLEIFISCAQKKLRPKGSFYFIFPVKRLFHAFTLMQTYQFCPAIVQFVQADNTHSAKLVVVKAVRGKSHELKVPPPILQA
jgi:tRNA1(Val) A37 N6-methylase TrmN6